jgi:hypothetical protein
MDAINNYVLGDDGIHRHVSEVSEQPKEENTQTEKPEETKEVVNEQEKPEETVVEAKEESVSKEEVKDESIIEPSKDLEDPKEGLSKNKDEEGGDVKVKDEEQKTVSSLSDQDVLSFLSEKLGKDLNSFDDLAAGDKSEEKPLTDLDRALQDLKEWTTKSGLPLKDYFKHQKDYDSMPSLQLVEEEMRYKNPDFTEDEIKLEMEQYIPDEDVDDDRDIALKNLKLKKDSKVSRDILNGLKSELSEYSTEVSLTEDQKSDIEFAKSVKQIQKEQEEYSNSYSKSIKEESSKIKAIPLQLDDDLTIEYSISDLDRNEIPNLIAKMPHWYNEDGSMKHSAVVKDTAKIKVFDEAVKLSYQQGISKGQEMLLEKSKNSTLGNSQQKTFDNQMGDSKSKPKFSNISREMAPYINSLNGNI